MILSMGAILTRLSVTHGQRLLRGGRVRERDVPPSVKLWIQDAHFRLQKANINKGKKFSVK